MGIIESLKRLLGLKPREEPSPTAEETSPPAEPQKPITSVRGIGPKRAARLREIGITTLKDLSSASAEELAEKLGVSRRITEKWVAEARRLLEEA